MKGVIIPAEFVHNWNNAKPCHYCKGICEKMYKNTGFEPMCRPCAEENVKDNPDYLKGTDFVTDARFKCLAKACNANSLVFSEFLIGSCCYQAFLKATEEYPTTKVEKDVYRVLAVAKSFFNASIGRQQQTLGKMLQQKLNFTNAHEAYIAARNEFNKAEEHYNKEKSENEMMQKIMESSIKKINGMVHDPLAEDGGQKSACNLCMEKFDGEIRMEASLKCGHVACIKCLTEMSEKICHICRKEFKNEEIIRLYY